MTYDREDLPYSPYSSAPANERAVLRVTLDQCSPPRVDRRRHLERSWSVLLGPKGLSVARGCESQGAYALCLRWVVVALVG